MALKYCTTAAWSIYRAASQAFEQDLRQGPEIDVVIDPVDVIPLASYPQQVRGSEIHNPEEVQRVVLANTPTQGCNTNPSPAGNEVGHKVLPGSDVCMSTTAGPKVSIGEEKRPGQAENPIPEDDSKASQLVGKTAASLAAFDLFSLGIELKEYNEDEISKDGQAEIRRRVDDIRKLLESDESAQTGSIDVAKSILEQSGGLAESIRKAEMGPSLAVESIETAFVSNLDTNRLLSKNIRRRLQVLFRALIQQMGSCEGKHFARLNLTGFLDQNDNNTEPFFNLWLSTTSNRPDWVESRCSFKGELTESKHSCCYLLQESVRNDKTLGISLKDIKRCKTSDVHDGHVMGSDNDILSSMQIDESDNRLILERLSSPTVSMAWRMDQINHNSASNRLSNTGPPSVYDRGLLCLHLALSLLQMTSADWRGITWYTSNTVSPCGVFFLRNESSRSLVETRPYMSWCVEKTQTRKPISGLKCDPQLLDFARLLIEIHTWKPLPNSRFSGELGSRSPCESLRKDLLRYINRDVSPQPATFILALKACLEDPGRAEAADADNSDKIQSYIFLYIFKPIYEAFGGPDIFNTPMNPTILMNSDQNDSDKPIYHAELADTECESKYEITFWKKMDTFLNNHIRPLRSRKHLEYNEPARQHRVRIAIIDSGVRSEDPEIAAGHSLGRIREYRNFTSPCWTDCEDEIGHGTRVARLLRKVAPEADLYIAKVSSRNFMTNRELFRITKAIKWAVKQKVDIISISLALSEPHYDTKEELEYALRPDDGEDCSIVFAAAGNNGILDSKAWPASERGVIAVYGTDGSGSGTKYNPQSQGSLNFATLGTNIKMKLPSASSSTGGEATYISGSSYATPIAAGIAANILEFSKHQAGLNGWAKKKLYEYNGMIKVLEAMSVRKDGYNFLHPLSFWEEAVKAPPSWRHVRDVYYGNPENINRILEDILK